MESFYVTAVFYVNASCENHITAVVNNYRTKDHFAPLLSFDLSNVAIKLYS